jgi:murein DD-endopeptidase MepM/ murein hydrolase activator NlpD
VIQRHGGGNIVLIAFQGGYYWIDSSSGLTQQGTSDCKMVFKIIPTLTPTIGAGGAPPVVITHNCKGKVINASGVFVRTGPSADDLSIYTGQTKLRTGTEFMIVARADDLYIPNQTWVGFYLPDRAGFLSWTADTVAGSTYVEKTGADCSRLPKLVVQPDTNWGDTLTGQVPYNPVGTFNTGQVPFFRGFGMSDAKSYSSITNCQHPGFDFPSTANMTIRSIYSGIVVGMGRENEQDRPAAWGATIGGYNLVIRSGGHFVLYGHLSRIHGSLYYGKRVTAGEEIGILADQGGDTHLHIQITAFNIQDAADKSLRSYFGSIRRSNLVNGEDVTTNPTLVTDFIYYVPQSSRGDTPTPAVGTNSGCANGNANYPYSITTNTSLWITPFGYNTRDSVKLGCFDFSGSVFLASACLSKHP